MIISNTLGLSTYDVPADHTALLHNMSVWIRDDGGGHAGLRPLTVALDDPQSIVWDLNPLRMFRGVYQWQARDVFTRHLYLDVPDLFDYEFRCSGYLLQNP